MPFINAKITSPVDDAKKNLIQSKLTDLVADAFAKPKKFVMINIEDNQPMWFGGEVLKSGAFISVRLIGNPSRETYSALTKKICELLEKELRISPDSVYVTFHPVEMWGRNGDIL